MIKKKVFFFSLKALVIKKRNIGIIAKEKNNFREIYFPYL